MSASIGILGHRDPREVARLPGPLMLPLREEFERHSINSRHGPEGCIS